MATGKSSQAEGRSGRRSGFMNVDPFARARRFGKRFVVALGVAGALSVAPLVASADTGLTDINLDCGDGYPLKATVDSQTVLDIQDALNALINYPSGLNCTLSTNVNLNPLATPMTDPFIVGGGRYAAANLGGPNAGTGLCFFNFGVSAHQDADGQTHGSSHLVETTQSPDNTCTSNGGEAHANVTCVGTPTAATDAFGNAITVDSTYGAITHATGDFATTFQTSSSPAMKTNATAPYSIAPNGEISHRLDTVFVNPPPVGHGDCVQTKGAFPVEHGKIHMGTK